MTRRRPCPCQHSCGMCLAYASTVHLLPRGSTAYEFTRLSLALRVARAAIGDALAPLAALLGRGDKRSNGDKGAGA